MVRITARILITGTGGLTFQEAILYSSDG